MKKTIPLHPVRCRGLRMVAFVLVVLLLLAVLGGCLWLLLSPDPETVPDALPPFEHKAIYSHGGFQDFTDFGWYTYTEVTAQQLEQIPGFRKVTAGDVGELRSYVEDFEGWVQMAANTGTRSGKALQQHYCFQLSQIQQEDYFHITTGHYGASLQACPLKFDDYTLYYFDMSEQVLYYFHSNI